MTTTVIVSPSLLVVMLRDEVVSPEIRVAVVEFPPFALVVSLTLAVLGGRSDMAVT